MTPTEARWRWSHGSNYASCIGILQLEEYTHTDIYIYREREREQFWVSENTIVSIHFASVKNLVIYTLNEFNNL